MNVRWLIACLVVTSASVGYAGSLEEKRWQTENDKAMKANTDGTNKRCGTKLTGAIDWSGFKFDDWQAKLRGYPFQGVGRALAIVCKDADGKAAVQKAIKKIVVKSTTEDPKLELKDGELQYFLSLKGGKIVVPDDEAAAWLTKHL